MASPPLFDLRQLPEGVIAPAKLASVDALIARLRARLVGEVELSGPTTAAIGGMVRAHNQCFIRRCLYFAEAGAGAVAAGYGLASLTIARSLIETVASYLDFAAQLEALLGEGDPGRLRDFVHAGAFAGGGPTEPGASAAWRTELRHQIEYMDRLRPGTSEEYERLCEELHPSAFRTWIYFARHDKEAGVVRFPAIAQSDADYLQWMVASVQLLAEFEAAVARIEGAMGAGAPLRE
jgi:hypothetical protein